MTDDDLRDEYNFKKLGRASRGRYYARAGGDPRVHRACGGGVVYNGPAPGDGRPQFRCTKCNETWTCGMDGGPWAGLVPPLDKLGEQP